MPLTSAPEIVVAGHVCLDLIPHFLGNTPLEPGQLIEVGAADLSPGGCVSNVGRALDRLGVSVRLVGKIGDDPFGEILSSLLGPLGRGLRIEPDGATSYSVVINPPGRDRTFLHMPGENDRFSADDLDAEMLTGAKVLHFGYPPLMARMFADEGRELQALLRKACEARITTSLDLSLPDPGSGSGRAPWPRILKRILPYVDLFLPGDAELAFMLGRETHEVEAMIDQSLAMGAGAVILKRGERGLLAQVGPSIHRWAGQTAAHPCFRVEAVGTTGAGDATIAGFLMGFVRGFSLEECLRAGCAAGACCVEAPDATSGIRSWPETNARIADGWASL